MIDVARKTILIFAGANGAGKTTAAQFLLPHHPIRQFVNADEIARGLSPFAPETQRIEAGRLVVRRIQELIGTGESFAYETTLSGRSQIAWIRRAREAGYKIVMYYIYIEDVSINLDRVSQRVRQGGHNVPGEDIQRRYGRSLENFFRDYHMVCDMIEVHNNSWGGLKLVARKIALEADYTIFDPASWERLINEGRRL